MGLYSSDMTFLNVGHALMAACAACYLAWWIIFFRPNIPKVQGPLYGIGVGCIICAALCGILGAIFIVVGSQKIGAQASHLSGWPFVLGAVVLYFLLAFVTKRLFHRPITTELVLFVAWTALELYCLYVLAATSSIGIEKTVVLVIAVCVLFVFMLITYILYYRLGPLPSFIDGALPLLSVAIYSLSFLAAL